MGAVALGDETATVAADESTRPREPRTRRASAPLLAGERYELGEPIGRGGMGEVYAAFDAQIGREVAIKRMHARKPTPVQLERFAREARIQGRLQHPAIPPVHELAVDSEGRPYFVMKKLEGVTLAEILRDPASHAAFTRTRLLRAFVEVCHAIELAHAHRIIHRDLKPSNVLLGERGEVYVLDWGIARELDAQDGGRNLIIGTPAYMAPEQARGNEDLDARVDVFALGCLLYEILTRQPRNPRGGAPAPSDELPLELDHVCRASTALDRDQRIGSVRELADTVEQYLEGDRDHERRRDLAARHLAVAQAALVRPGDDQERRQIAMREAGRALALDPTLTGAAELVGRLMIVPPAITPTAVVAELAALDRAADRRQLRQVATLNTAHLFTIPIMMMVGIHDVLYLVAFGVFAGLNIAGQIGALYSERVMRAAGPLAAVFAVASLALLCRMFTPFLVAPGFAAVALMSFAMSSIARERRVVITFAALSIATILGTWAAEAVGLLSQTMWIDGATIVLRSPMEGMETFPAVPALSLYVIMLIASAASIANALSRNHYRSRVQLQVQSWQLRQLI